jgi:hypothetical protein
MSCLRRLFRRSRAGDQEQQFREPAAEAPASDINREADDSLGLTLDCTLRLNLRLSQVFPGGIALLVGFGGDVVPQKNISGIG